MVHGQAFSPVVETKNATRVRQSQVIGKSADVMARMGMSAAQRKTARLLWDLRDNGNRNHCQNQTRGVRQLHMHQVNHQSYGLRRIYQS